jgi:hypothetical protein
MVGQAGMLCRIKSQTMLQMMMADVGCCQNFSSMRVHGYECVEAVWGMLLSPDRGSRRWPPFNAFYYQTVHTFPTFAIQ